MNYSDSSREELQKEIESLKAKVRVLENDAILTETIKDELRVSQQRFEELTNLLPQVVYEIDLSGKITYVNIKAFELFGYSQEDLDNGLTVMQMIDPGYQEKAKRNIERSLKGEQPEDPEYLALRKDGSTFTVLIYTRPIYEDNSPIGISGIIVDISDRKKMDEALMRSKKQLSNILENTTNLFYSHTAEHKLIYLSPQSQYFLGCPPAEAMIRWTDFLSDNPLNEPGIKKTLKAIETGEKQAPYEIELVRKDGEKIWVEVNEAPIVENGKTQLIVGSLTDITERKLVEDKLKDSENRYRRLAENAPDMIYRMSLPGGNYEYVSPASSGIFGYTPEEFYEKPILISQAIHPDWKGYFEKQWMNLLKGEMPPFYEYQIINKSGEKRWINQRNVMVLSEDGKPEFIEGIVTDITQRKKNEEEIRQSELEAKKQRDRSKQYLEIADVILLSLDNKGMVQLVNTKGCKVLGYSQEEILGKNWYDNFLPPSIREDVKSIAVQVFAGEMESAHYHENDILTKSGEERLIAWYNSVLNDANGNIIGTISSGEDITERRKAENELKKHQEHLEELVHQRTVGLENKNKELDQMLKVFVGRELKIKSLQEELRILKQSR